MKPVNDCRAALMAELLGRPAVETVASDPLRPVLASLLAGRSLGEGVLPATLGLETDVFRGFRDEYFPGPPLRLASCASQDIPELTDLVDLLLEFRAGQRESEIWLARVVANGCTGSAHLWQDLGLADRGELSLLMATAFPLLAALNTGDMKWKKFIYHHYCTREGIFLCPSPSCGECADYDKCFAPES